MASSWLLFAGMFAFVSANHIPCSPQCRGEECYKNCRYGIETVCGESMCARGPGERCGGYLYQMGKCGEGMYCDGCGFCRGCSVNALISVVETKRKCYNSTHYCIGQNIYS